MAIQGGAAFRVRRTFLWDSLSRLGTTPAHRDEAAMNGAQQGSVPEFGEEVIRYAGAASVLGCSVRTIYYLLPAARRRLANTLDRLDLL